MSEKVTIYTIKQSEYCIEALNWLDKHEVKYHEITNF